MPWASGWKPTAVCRGTGSRTIGRCPCRPGAGDRAVAGAERDARPRDPRVYPDRTPPARPGGARRPSGASRPGCGEYRGTGVPRTPTPCGPGTRTATGSASATPAGVRKRPETRSAGDPLPRVTGRLRRVSDGTRTRDILDHNQVLYHLSYTHHDRCSSSGSPTGREKVYRVRRGARAGVSPRSVRVSSGPRGTATGRAAHDGPRSCVPCPNRDPAAARRSPPGNSATPRWTPGCRPVPGGSRSSRDC